MSSNPEQIPTYNVALLNAALAEISGARGRQTTLEARRPGLAIIDPQQIFLNRESPACVPDCESVTSNILLLAKIFRAADRPVVVTRHVENEGAERGTNPLFFLRVLTQNDPLSEIIPQLIDHQNADQATDLVITKNRHDAFSHGLPEILKDIDVLFLAGVKTPLCVLATATGLARYGITPAVVADACAARNPADHIAALRCLAAGHSWILTTAEVTDYMKKSVPATNRDRRHG